MNKEETLVKFGLEEKEAKVYLAILELGSSTITPIATRAGIKRTSIYYFIDHLVELGLISKFEKNSRMNYKAESPERLIELENERLAKLKDSLPAFIDLFNLTPHKPRVSYFEGPDQVRNVIREELKCKKEALYIWPGSATASIGGVRAISEIDKARIEKGIFIKTIRYKDADINYETSSHGLEYLRELRWGPDNMKVDVGIGIYDTGKISVFSTQKENFGMLIESKELYEAMKIFHRLLWEKSTEAKVGEG
ncbi:MAG: helix-turn-helix domain-containing protein [Candidatus Berkelbacteria bacterium]